MGNRSFKRALSELSTDVNEDLESLPTTKHMKTTSIDRDNVDIFLFQNLCTEILLEIFQYLRPVDILYSFAGLTPRFDAHIEPYTHIIDCRLINKSQSQQFIECLFPCLTNHLRVLSLGNAYTFNQITDILYKLDWSLINQLESLTFELITSDELSRYLLNIHPLLKDLWRLTLTFGEQNKVNEKILIEHVLLPSRRSQSLTYCFISGITFNLDRSVPQNRNEYLRELTLTLATVTDLIILFRIIPHLEILTCTVLSGECSQGVGTVPSLDCLATLTLTIQNPMTYNTLHKILLPHKKLKRLSLIATISNETTSSPNLNQEINGLGLEKLFRTFPQLKELCFYLRQLNSTLDSTSDSSYLFQFTSHFWLDRSIEVGTHFVREHKQRHTYTFPFAFDTFELTGDISLVFPIHHPSQYSHVRRLFLTTTSDLDEYTYSYKILKFFPNIQMLIFTHKPFSCHTTNLLNDHQWVLTSSQANTSFDESQPHVYILNGKKSRYLRFQTLSMSDDVQRSLIKRSSRARQLTIYEMSEEQAVNLTYYYPRLHVLTLHVYSLEWLFPPKNDWFFRFITNISSLFSLTIHYPKDVDEQKIRDLLVNTLVAVKKHFYIKCNDGLLIVWF